MADSSALLHSHSGFLQSALALHFFASLSSAGVIDAYLCQVVNTRWLGTDVQQQQQKHALESMCLVAGNQMTTHYLRPAILCWRNNSVSAQIQRQLPLLQPSNQDDYDAVDDDGWDATRNGENVQTMNEDRRAFAHSIVWRIFCIFNCLR